MKIAITGGHHSSALPVISQLKKDNPYIKIIWFGHKYSLKGDINPTLEYHDITNLRIPFINLHAGKVYKTFDITRLLKVPYGFFEALYYLLKYQPKVILSFGGYLAAPVVLAGWFLGIPCITHEQTLVVGYANKFISLFAKKILVSWESSAKYFPSQKVIYAGLPLRKEIFTATTDNFKVNTALPTIYITAGKTGSHKINEAINACLPELLNICNVIHQCGDNSVFNDYDLLDKTYSGLRNLPGKYCLRKFVINDEIGEALRKADLVISRAGAHIITELLVLEKPCVLIPIPWVSHGEQFKNATFIKNLGLAKILEEKDLSPKSLLEAAQTYIKNKSLFKLNDEQLKNQVLKLSENSTKIIVDTIYKYANY